MESSTENLNNENIGGKTQGERGEVPKQTKWGAYEDSSSESKTIIWYPQSKTISPAPRKVLESQRELWKDSHSFLIWH